MQIYEPADDSYFLSDILKEHVPKLLNKNPALRALEVGCGSGVQLTALKSIGVKNILGCDINPKAVDYCKKLGFKCVKSGLFQKVMGKFDLIVFNPPYLPEDKFDNLPDTSGGKKGDETILNFLKRLKNYLNKNGKCFLLTSSLTPTARIKKQFENYNVKLIAKKKLFQEELYVLELVL